MKPKYYAAMQVEWHLRKGSGKEWVAVEEYEDGHRKYFRSNENLGRYEIDLSNPNDLSDWYRVRLNRKLDWEKAGGRNQTQRQRVRRGG